MSGEIDIIHGGAIAVDTDLLRDLATRLRAVVERVDAAGRSALQASMVPTPIAFIGVRPGRHDVGWDVSPLSVVSTRLQGLADILRETAIAVERMCEVYELVELRARLRFASEAEAAVLAADLADMEAADPTRARMADWVTAAWEEQRFEGFHEQTAIGSPLLLWMLPLFTGAVMGAGVRHGLLEAGAALRPGSAGSVTVTETSRTTRAHAPQSLGEALEQFPKDGPQLRVDRYRMPDGTDEFVLYAAGTKGVVGDQPWDMTSNVQMYLGGAESASYRATLDALAAAGAEPGATVHALGYSQGGMIASFLASGGEYEVPTLITAGSPVEPTLGEQTLVVQLRHTDDPVSALAGGGSATGTGAAESIVAQRQRDPLPSPGDLVLTAHHLSGYVETAEMLDATADSRLRRLDDLWVRLGTATGIESTQYLAEREG